MLKKFLRSKLFISAILLVLAAVLVFGLLPMNYEKQAQTIHVVQFVDDVTLGTQITESMLTTREIGLYGVDKNVITDKNAIIGKYAAMDIRRTSNLYSDMFADTWTEVKGAIDTLLGEQDKLVTVSLGSGAASVGGLVKSGSIVDVLTQQTSGSVEYDEFGYPKSGSNGASMQLVPIMQNIMVYEVLNDALENIADLERQWVSLVQSGDDAAKSFDSSLTPAYVTLIVNEEQALMLANQEYSGKIHLVLSPNASAEDVMQDSFIDNAQDATPDEAPADTDTPVDENGQLQQPEDNGQQNP